MPVTVPDNSIRSRADLAAWLQLLAAPGLGRITARRLLERCPDARALLALSGAQRLALLAGQLLAPEQRQAIAALGQLAVPDTELDAIWAWRSQAGHHLLCQSDAAFPARLCELPDPPLLLYVLGRPDLLQARSLAVVGSRRASAGGRALARSLARELSEAGLCIVSGMALGIDGAAHEGALAGPSGTVAVLGTGIDRCYPARHHGLMQRIAAAGCVISEYPLGTPPMGTNFPLRNRLIGALGAGVLVLEAAERSGSLITARQAIELGRTVMAVPGAVQSGLARGCHRLIRDGAALVECANDVLTELAWPGYQAGPAPVLGGDAVLDAVGAGAARAEQLAALLGWPLGEVQAALLELEMLEMIERLPGGLIQLGKAGAALVADQESLLK